MEWECVVSNRLGVECVVRVGRSTVKYKDEERERERMVSVLLENLPQTGIC